MKPAKLRTTSAAETRAVAASIGRILKPGVIMLLVGGFGSGKTTFVQGLAEGLGVADLRVVCSPTYVMMNVYRGATMPVFHMDATRFDDPREIFGLGWEEADQGVTVIEWGDKVGKTLPGPHLVVEFRVVGETRREISMRSENEAPEPGKGAKRPAAKGKRTGTGKPRRS